MFAVTLWTGFVLSVIRYNAIENQSMMRLTNQSRSSCANRPQYRHVLTFFLLCCGTILLLTLVKFNNDHNRLHNDRITSIENHHQGPKSQSDLSNEPRSAPKNSAVLDIGRYDEVVLWSSDFHISPIADIKNIVQEYGVKVIDKSLSGHCHLTKTCQTDLKIINEQNGISLGKFPTQLKEQFYEYYRNDIQMTSVSAFLCLHATSMCELYMPFKKPMIIIASTR